MPAAPMRPPIAGTLIDLLDLRRRDTPGRPAFTFGGNAYTFAWLWDEVGALAAGLAQRGIGRGDHVVLVFPNGPDFLAAFYAVQRLGAVAVPIFPGSSPERIASIANLCEAALILLPDDAPGDLVAGVRQQPHGDRLARIGEARAVGSIGVPPPEPDDVAYIQFTSGSTGNPKGVILSHANLLTNVVQMIEGMEITADDVFVSWLPAYHDMGLVLMTMAPFYLAAALHLLPADLRSVRSWLTALAHEHATFTASPDFGYRLLLRHVRPEDPPVLSSLRVALNAAEPVRTATLEAFHATFGLRDVMVAGYGLAEATVGVSMWPPRTTNAIDERGRVSTGRPFPGIELMISTGDGMARAETEGEILVRSPANTRGYYNNPAETGRLFWGDGVIRTGDNGYLDPQGNLTIVARTKEIIKVGGETVAPEEIEEAGEGVAGVRACAAVGIDRGDTAGEQAVVFAEVRGSALRGEAAMEETVIAIVDAVHARLGLRPARVYLVRELPRTPNGKLQRGPLRERHLDGSLRRDGGLLFPEY